ncbi:MAG: hypothetical protein GF320_01530 [Armatimonadia bacterium]|nr:hypothetical protein [Armatimonadia bacterium]
MPKKEKAFDCVEMKRQAQARIAREIEGLSVDQQVAYWAERTRRLKERIAEGHMTEPAEHEA